MLASSASFINCTSGVNGDSPTELTRNDINIVVQGLVSNNAYAITDMIGGEDRFGSSPIRASYFALCNTALISSFENVNGFVNVSQYSAMNKSLRSEWGSIGNLRFLISSIGSTNPNGSMLGATVYNIFCMGMDAYAIVEQNEYSAQFIYRAPLLDGPLALNSTIGYKFAQVPRILNDLWLINARCTI